VNTSNDGVLDRRYGVERLKKPELIFRYKMRALVAAQTARRHLLRPAPYDVVDLGSAEGLALIEARSLLPTNVNVGIERSRELIEMAPAMPADSGLLAADVSRLPLADESADLVTALAILEHLTAPVETMRETARVLRPGGVMVATCPIPIWDEVSTRLHLLRDEQHESHLGKKVFGRLCAQANLDPVEYRRFMWAPVGFLPYLHLPVPLTWARVWDGVVQRFPLANLLFVNQLMVARKPGGQNVQ